MDKIYLIYIITNIVNNKNYIGKTTKTINARLKKHIESIKYKTGKGKYHLTRAIAKYGPTSFTIKQIDHGYSYY